MISLSAPSLFLASAAAATPLPAVPEPTLRPGLSEQDVTPGIEGFLFTALMVAMALLVFRLMVRSVRRVQQRSPDAEQMLVERHQAHLPAEARTAGDPLDADADQRLERLRRTYPGYLQDPTPEPQAPDSGR
ncbi:hypothetical protein [Micrococcus sp.]|uniref:hypothetical protein n=1 Tax=Micrococcus sp. TaxID=1271 RepID=UPI002A90AABE|nr:hypothetical protein [Micrococcus sp.]MDY6055362.1 hypothetical protein [Micrococcus sp.]